MRRSTGKRLILVVSLLLLAGTLLEKELFAVTEITELNEQNYRSTINTSGKTIVMYYAEGWKYTAEGRVFMKELQHKIPSAKYFAIDLKKFKNTVEVDKIFAEDISGKQVPAFVSYAKGRVVIRKEGAPLTKKETNASVSSFLNADK